MEAVKERSSNFEILRIIAMCAIVAYHFADQTHALDVLSGSSLFAGLLLGSMGRISVNLFLFTGVWFMVEQKFRPEKILILYGTVWFYVFSIMVLMRSAGISVSFADTVKSLFPFFELSLWFVSVYIILMLLSPFLQKILNWEKPVLKTFLLTSGFIMVVLATLGHKSSGWLAFTAWFCFVYLAIGYYKKHIKEKTGDMRSGGGISISVSALLYLIMVIVCYVCLENKDIPACRAIYKYTEYCFGEVKTLPNILISAGIFYRFLSLDAGRIKGVNLIAKSSLAVYIIHQTPCFQNFLWHNILLCDKYLYSKYFILYFVFVILSVYIFCFIIDLFRLNYIEPLWVNSRLFKFLKLKLEKLYEHVI